SDRFAERERATRELARQAGRAEEGLRRFLTGRPSLEARRRAEDLLDRLRGPLTDTQRLRRPRALEAPEHIRTAQAPRSVILNDVVKHAPEPLARVFFALSDPTRRAILARVADAEVTVTEIAAPFSMSLAAVSKHIRVLEQAGLLERTRRGREHRLRFVA